MLHACKISGVALEVFLLFVDGLPSGPVAREDTLPKCFRHLVWRNVHTVSFCDLEPPTCSMEQLKRH